jgi:hypothetical protein
MTKQRTAIVVAISFLSSLSLGQTVHVSIDARHSLRSINPWLYGINTARWDESLFPEPADDMLLSADRDAIEKIKASGVTVLKYPGGNDADQYIWNSASNNATEMDTDEFIALCREVGAEPFITVNFNESPALAAAWVRYCNQLKGYDVRFWEVGDEQWGTWARGHASPEEYAKKYVEFVKAMREIDPSIKVATNVPLGQHPENWTERVLKATSGYVDMLTFTYFPQRWGQENDDTLFASVSKFRDLVTQLRSDVERALGPEEASSILFVNVGYNSVNHSPGPQTLHVVNALWAADMLGTMAHLGIDIACYWALHNFYPPRGGDYGYLSSDGSNTPRYSYYVFPMLVRRLDGELLWAQADDPSISVYASRAGKSLSIACINKDRKSTRNLEIDLAGFAPRERGHVWILDAKRKNKQLPDLRKISKEFSFNVPPYSLTLVQLIEGDSIPPPQNLAQLAVPSASSFSTIGPHFTPASAVDGKLYTRWNSAAWTNSNGQEAQWFRLAWKQREQIARVIIRWGESRAVQYRLEASNDGKTWRTVREITGGLGGIDELEFPPFRTRYLRIEGSRGTKGISAYSIREIEVFGEPSR